MTVLATTYVGTLDAEVEHDLDSEQAVLAVRHTGQRAAALQHDAVLARPQLLAGDKQWWRWQPWAYAMGVPCRRGVPVHGGMDVWQRLV